MFCESCGAKNDDTSQFCENCGASLAPEPYTASESPLPPGTASEGVSYARIGVVVGVLGIFLFFFFIFGPVAIILGYLGYKRGDERTGKIAMIVGGVATFLSLIITPVIFG